MFNGPKTYKIQGTDEYAKEKEQEAKAVRYQYLKDFIATCRGLNGSPYSDVVDMREVESALKEMREIAKSF